MESSKPPSSYFRWKYLKVLLIGTLLTGIICYFITSPIFIEPLYQSEALIFVPLTIPNKQIEQQGIGFASDIEIDGHIQILQSGRLRDTLIKRYSYDKEFGIDLDEIGGKSKLFKKINSRIQIQKTRYSSVSVTVKDHDPEKAAEIANTIVELGDLIKEGIFYANRREVFLQAKSYYEEKEISVTRLEHEIDSLENRIKSSQANRMESNKLLRLQNQYPLELQKLFLRKNHLETVERDFNSFLPSSYIISKAIPVTSAVWPKRAIIALAGMFGYLLLIIIIEIIRRDVKRSK